MTTAKHDEETNTAPGPATRLRDLANEIDALVDAGTLPLKWRDHAGRLHAKVVNLEFKAKLKERRAADVEAIAEMLHGEVLKVHGFDPAAWAWADSMHLDAFERDRYRRLADNLIEAGWMRTPLQRQRFLDAEERDRDIIGRAAASEDGCNA